MFNNQYKKTNRMNIIFEILTFELVPEDCIDYPKI